jgi:hypothetical protein
MTELVKIPTKHYVGLNFRQEGKLPLAFMTPHGTDAASAKRMASVDRWCSQYRNKNKGLKPMVMDNVPMTGFAITKDIRTTNYGGLDHWRIEDPRGFELEISSGNLAQLISVGTIENGVILDSCVWARSGGNNILLSTSTQEYKDAVVTTQIANSKASWRDVKLGNRIVLQNTVSGIYLGKFHTVNWDSSLYNKTDQNSLSAWNVSDKADTVIWDDVNNKLVLTRSPKLSAITDSDCITAVEAEQQANTLMESHNSEYDYKYCTGLVMEHNKSHNISDVKYELVELANTQAHNGSTRRCYCKTSKVFGQYNNYRNRLTTLTVHQIDWDKLQQGQLEYVWRKEKQSGFIDWRDQREWITCTVEVDVSQIVSAYDLYMQFVTPLGNTIRHQV